MRVVVRKAHPTRCLCRRIAAKARPKLKADRGYLFLDKMTPESPKDSGAGPVESLKLKNDHSSWETPLFLRLFR